jgi:hypothetical protein
MQCHKCKCEVVDGANGSISPPPPWDPSSDSIAECYACENKAEQEYEQEQVRKSVDAAMKAGRFDCL